jgi:hypothetical protein
VSTPEKVLKERMKEDKRLKKLKNKLEKKYKAGKIDQATYMKELHKIGFVTQKEVLDDFRKVLREEIDRLEKYEMGVVDDDLAPEDAEPSSATEAEDLYGDELLEKPISELEFKRPKDFGVEKKKSYDEKKIASEAIYEDEVEVVDEEAADWNFEDSDLELDEDADEVVPDVDVVKIDRRSGVLEYDEIKHADFSDVKIMDSYDQAAEVGVSRKRKKKRKRAKAKEPPKEVGEEDVEVEFELEEEPELTEAERIILEMEEDSDEQLDLEEVFIPDVESTIKSKRAVPSRKKETPEIMWEADQEDKVWLKNRFLEEIEALKSRRQKWRNERSARLKAAKEKLMEDKEIEKWHLVKLMHETVLVKVGGKLRKQKKEVWKVRVVGRGARGEGRKAKDEERKAKGEGRKEKRKEERKGKKRKKKEKKDEEEIEWD